MADLAGMVEKIVKLAGDLEQLDQSYGKIKVDVEGIAGDVETLGHVKADTGVTVQDLIKNLDTRADEIMHKIYEKVSVFRDVIDWITGHPDRIDKAADHWKTDVPKQFDQNKWHMEENVKTIQEHWKGRLSNGVCALLSVESKLVEALGKVSQKCGAMISTVGAVLIKLRDLILHEIGQLILVILKNLAKASFVQVVPGVGQALDLAAAVAMSIPDIYDAYNAIKDLVKKFTDLCDNIGKAIKSGQTVFGDLKALAQ